MFDLDVRKNFDPSLVSRFGPPIVNIPNPNPNLTFRILMGTSHAKADIGVSTALEFLLGSNDSDPVTGLMGGGYSSITMPTASLAAVLKVPQVSYGATSEKLSNKQLYPYFMRTAPTDSFEATAMWQFLVEFQVPSAIFFYTEEPFGQSFFTSITSVATQASQAFRIKGMGLRLMYDEKDLNATTQKVRLAKELGSRFYFMAMVPEHFTFLAYVLEQENMLSGSWQAFGCDSCTLSPHIFTPIGGYPIGYMRWESIGVGPLYSKFEEMWLKMKAEDVVGPAAWKRYRLGRLKVPLGAHMPTDSMFESSVVSSYRAYLFDAGYAFAFAFNTMLNNGFKKADIKNKALLDQMKLTDFEGVSGHVSFNPEGDRLASYSFGNYQPDPDDPNRTVFVIAGVFNSKTRSLVLNRSVDLYWMVGEQGKSLPAKLTACEAGYFQEEGTQICRSCGPGMISAGGTSTCERCPAGTRANALQGATACLKCDFGTNAAESGSTVCNKCEEGSYAEMEGAKICEKCVMGFFQDKAGKKNCTECPPRQATNFFGARSKSDCMCQRGWYRTSTEQVCQPCPQGMICEFGSELSLYWTWHEAGRPTGQALGSFPLLQEGYTSLANDPLDIYRCKEKSRCPGGPPGSCGLRLRVDQISCGRCEDAWFWDGVECLQCGEIETSSALFPLLPIIFGPVVICSLYFLFRDDLAKWDSWQNGLSSMSFILLNHYQLTKLAHDSNVDWPSNVSTYFSFWAFTDDLLTIFNPECSGFGDIAKVVVLRAVSPVVMAALFCFTFGASRVVQHFTKRPVGMLRDRVLNLFFSLILTFFAGISELSLTIFKCHPNPNGVHTLNADETVICGSSAWEAMTVVGILAVIVYILGCGGVFIWVLFVAPWRFGDPAFQRRWKFLFIKYRPDVYWWSIVFILKGFVMNVGFVLVDQGILQINWLMIVVLMYCGACFYWLPWRHRVTNAADIYCHLCLNYVLSLSTSFARMSSSEEDEIKQNISNAIVCISASPLVFCALLSYILLRMQLSSSFRAKASSSTIAMSKDFKEFNAMTTKELMAFMRGISEWDRYYMTQAHRVIRFEYLGHFHRRASGRIVARDTGASSLLSKDTLQPERTSVVDTPNPAVHGASLIEEIDVEIAVDGTRENSVVAAAEAAVDPFDLSNLEESLPCGIKGSHPHFLHKNDPSTR